MFGLTFSELQAIVDVVKVHPEVHEALIFGSRALETHKKGSDIDIALKGENLDIIAPKIGGILNEESHLPYFFDIIDYNQIVNSDLKDHIDRVGRQIYKKS